MGMGTLDQRYCKRRGAGLSVNKQLCCSHGTHCLLGDLARGEHRLYFHREAVNGKLNYGNQRENSDSKYRPR